MTAPTPGRLLAPWLGAPERQRRALEEALGRPDLPRASRRELTRALDRLRPAPSGLGVVPFPAVVPGTRDGAVYRVVAATAARGDLARVPDAVVQRVRAALQAALPALDPSGVVLHVSGPAPDGGRWSGRSVELALTAAVASWALGVPPRDDVVVTGAVEGGRVTPVAFLDDKRALVARDLPGARLAHPVGPLEAALDAVLRDGWRDALVLQSAVTPARRARVALEAARGREDARALAEAEAALAGADGDPAIVAQARWARAMVHLHAGRAHDADADLDAVAAALPAWAEHADTPPAGLAREELVAHAIVAWIDQGRLAAALARAKATVAQLDGLPERPERVRFVTLSVAGSGHRAAIALGDLDLAASLLLDHGAGRSRLHHQLARVLGDLAEVRRRQGRPDAARALLEAARRALPDAAPDQRDLTARFVDLFEARLDVDAGRPAPAPPADTPPWPRLGFELLAARRSADPAAALGRWAQDPWVRSSLPLRWLLAEAAAAAVVEGHDAARGLLYDVGRWSVDDPDLAAHLQAVSARPDEDDLRAFRARCPY